MRVTHGIAAFALAAAMLAVAPPARAQTVAGPRTPADADDIYPKAYVCKNLQYNDVSDKPGTCSGDKTALVPIRLGTAYKCLRGPANYQATDGKCETDGNPKGAVTVSVFWTCGTQRYLDPGACADKSLRLIQFEERPHGDHNPRHGGAAIFMSKDLFHHVEGTYVAPGIFRVYFYNEFTKPMKAAGFTGRVALTNANSDVIGPEIPLAMAKVADGSAMEARIPNAPVPSKASPVHIKLLLKFKAGDVDFVTDHVFPEYSKEPPAAAPAPKVAAVPSPAPPKPAAAKPAAPKPAPKPAAVAPQESGPAQTTAMSGGAEIGGGATQPLEALPDSKPELLAMLKDKAANVTKLLGEGQMGGVWYPAITAKDVALALEAGHEDGLSPEQKAQMASSVKQLTVTAWAIDAAGDLGNGQQLQQLNDQFQTAVAEIMKVYGR